MAFLSLRQEANFSSMVSPEPNSGCWIWTGYATSEGYGRVSINNTVEQAHRVSYLQYRGQIAPGHLVLHSCDLPCCVNPQHLRVGTDAENGEDKAKRRRVPTKITDAQVIAVRAESGRYRDIAKKFNISPAWVCRIKTGTARQFAKDTK